MYAHFWNFIESLRSVKKQSIQFLHFWKNNRQLKKNYFEKLTVKLRWYVGMFRGLAAYTNFLSEEIRLSLTISFVA